MNLRKKIFNISPSILYNQIGIDLGTSTTYVNLEGKGIIFSEPSYIIFNKKTNQIDIVGGQAHEMLGRTPEHLEVIQPIKDGVIADFDVTEQFIKYLLKKADGMSPKMLPPTVVAGVPAAVSAMNAESVSDAVLNAGAREVHIVYEPIAAAIGIGLPIESEKPTMIIDIGGGTSDTMVLASNGIVAATSITVAGDLFNQAIQKNIALQRGVKIGVRTAETIKIATFLEAFNSKTRFKVRGVDTASGLPTEILVDPKEVYHFIEEPISKMAHSLRDFVMKLPTEVAGDLVNGGTYLVGGGALIPGFRKSLSDILGIRIDAPESPLTAVVRGTSIIAKNPNKYKHFFVENMSNQAPSL